MPSTYNNINLLRTNVGVIDAKTFASLSSGGLNGEAAFRNYLSLSPFMKKPYYQQTDHIRQQNYEEKTENLKWGGSVKLQFEKSAPVLTKTYLELDLSAVVPNGVGTYARLQNYAGLVAIQKITFTSTEQDFDVYPTLKNFLSITRNTSDEEYALEVAPLKGNLSIAQRNALALAPQTLRVDLKPYWDEILSASPILSSISRILRVTIDFCTLDTIVQQDYTLPPTLTINAARLAYETVHLPAFERDYLSKVTLTDRGLSHLYEDFHSFTTDIAAGLTEKTIKLEGFQLPFFESYLFFQPATDIDTPYQKKYFELDHSILQNIASIQFRESQSLVIDELRGYDDIAKRWQENHKDIPFRQPLVLCRAALDAKKVGCHLSGTINPQNFSNYTVYIKFKAPLTQTLYVTHCNIEPNFTVQQGGEIQRTFN